MTDIIPPLEIVPIEPLPPLSERERIHACAMTAIALQELETGDSEINISPEDAQIARSMFKEGRDPTPSELKRSGVVMQLEALLTEYDYALIDDANRIRNYVTNRLIKESDHNDPKIRIRALELLGKLSNVGIFSEKHEIVVSHQATEVLEAELKKHLTILLDPSEVKVTHVKQVHLPNISANDVMKFI